MLISCDLFVLIFMCDGPIFWRHQMEAAMGNPKNKRKKRNTKKEHKKTITSYVTLLGYLKNTFFTIITFRGKLL